MQLAATDALDLSQESAATQEMYGIGREPTDSYGRRCLIARRLVERGVRFVQLYINGQIWDNHTAPGHRLKAACDRTDLPIAALLRDLKQRGLLDSTLVVWGGEFGRLPIAQLPADKDERKAGRDHNKNAFCTWMAGAGVKGGIDLRRDRRTRPGRRREPRQRPRLARHDPAPARAAPRATVLRAERPEGEADRRERGAGGEGDSGLSWPC